MLMKPATEVLADRIKTTTRRQPNKKRKHSQQQNNKQTKINSVVEPTQEDSNKPSKPGEEE